MPGVSAARRVWCLKHGSMGKSAWERREQGGEEEGRSMSVEGTRREGRGEEHGSGGSKEPVLVAAPRFANLQIVTQRCRK